MNSVCLLYLSLFIHVFLLKADLALRRMSDGSVCVDGTPVHSCGGCGSRRGSNRTVPHGTEPIEPALSEPVSISNSESYKHSVSLNGTLSLVLVILVCSDLLFVSVLRSGFYTGIYRPPICGSGIKNV